MITFFFAEYLYLNPGMPLLYEELKKRAGSGARVVNVTTAQRRELESAIRAASVIVIDISIYNAATWAKPGEFSVYFIVDQKPHGFYQEVLDRLLESSSPKLFVLYVDLHDKKNARLFETIRGKVDAICWNFEQEPISVGSVLAAHRDSWLTPDHDPTGLWHLARKYFPVRVDLPFAIADNEFSDRPSRHVWDICVPGAPYLTRRIAARSARKAALRVAPFHMPSRLLAGASARILPLVLPNKVASSAAIGMQQLLQKTLVRSVPINFVCGGPLSFPVRKFFEIPAAHTAMVAYPCSAFRDYGFKDGWNFVASTPEETGCTARTLLAKDASRREIARRGFEMVRKFHSVKVRADQLLDCLGRLEAGRLSGARFVEGKFEIN